MSYRYSFDYTPALFLRGDYALAKKALDLLRSEIQVWNDKALSHGALSAPYQREIEDLDYFTQQLAVVEASGGILTNIAVGFLRYLKAALVLLATRKEVEISGKVKDGWPESVIESMREGLRQINFFSGALEVAPADVLNEITVGLGG